MVWGRRRAGDGRGRMLVVGLDACRAGAWSCGGTDPHTIPTPLQEGPADGRAASVLAGLSLSLGCGPEAWREKFAQEKFAQDEGFREEWFGGGDERVMDGGACWSWAWTRAELVRGPVVGPTHIPFRRHCRRAPPMGVRPLSFAGLSLPLKPGWCGGFCEKFAGPVRLGLAWRWRSGRRQDCSIMCGGWGDWRMISLGGGLRFGVYAEALRFSGRSFSVCAGALRFGGHSMVCRSVSMRELCHPGIIRCLCGSSAILCPCGSSVAWWSAIQRSRGSSAIQGSFSASAEALSFRDHSVVCDSVSTRKLCRSVV